MAILFIRHRVQDYTKWQQFYASVAPMQKQAGVVAEAVYQADGDPNDVTVTHEFSSVDQAKAFVESAELREAMATAGVIGAPTTWLAHRT